MCAVAGAGRGRAPHGRDPVKSPLQSEMGGTSGEKITLPEKPACCHLIAALLDFVPMSETTLQYPEASGPAVSVGLGVSVGAPGSLMVMVTCNLTVL